MRLLLLRHHHPLHSAGLFLILLIGEMVADRQMFAFQTEKYKRISAKTPLGPKYERGFIETGTCSYACLCA
jgi:steroid 5-alpha reductase family enzyme